MASICSSKFSKRSVDAGPCPEKGKEELCSQGLASPVVCVGSWVYHSYGLLVFLEVRGRHGARGN